MPKHRHFIDASIGELISRMDEGSLDGKELIQAAMENIAENDSDYLAWQVFRDEKWRSPGKGAPMDHVPRKASGLMKGIPIGVKDIYNTYDFPTEMGSVLWKGFMPGNDARAVYNLKREGAVVLGKTVTAEFAVHALEKTKNPWDVTKTPGTSSSGSAVAVSLGHVPMTTGTQTAGSIIRPASFCGVYGMKPSFGLIPRTGMLKTTDSLDTPGFFTFFREDLPRALESMRVRGRDYPISDTALNDPRRQTKPADRPWKIGFARTHTWEGAPKYAREAMEEFMKRLASSPGVEVTDTALPDVMKHTHETHETIYDKALSYYFQNEYKEANQISPIMAELIARGQRITVAEYQSAIARQMEMIYAMDDYFADFDAIVSLSTSGEAPDRDKVELPDPALMWTLSHVPAISAPVFFSPSGLPFGAQFIARKYNDRLLFSLLDTLEKKGLIPVKAGYAIDR